MMCLGAANVTNCVFIANKVATGYGGGVTQSEGSLGLTDCLFVGNRAADGGGAIRRRSGDATIRNCTFHGNRTSEGAFLYSFTESGAIEISNCIISNGDSELWNEGGSEILLRYTNLAGGEGTIHDPSGSVVWGAGNIEADPCFVDVGHWDPNGTADDPNDDFYVEGDYHLKSQAGRWDEAAGSWVQDDVTSPCIDAGDPNSPIGCEPFPSGGVINMGAYGGTAQASKSYFGSPLCQTVIAGDINGDCQVDIADVIILLDHWLQSGAEAEE